MSRAEYLRSLGITRTTFGNWCPACGMRVFRVRRESGETQWVTTATGRVSCAGLTFTQP